MKLRTHPPEPTSLSLSFGHFIRFLSRLLFLWLARCTTFYAALRLLLSCHCRVPSREGGTDEDRASATNVNPVGTNDKLRRTRASRSQFHFLYDAASSLRPSLTLIARVSRDCATEQSLDDACPQSEVRNSRLL